jgi:hypothetical protein
MSEMVERVALAIQQADNEPCPDGVLRNADVSDWGEYVARAAIAAMREPDKAMIDAGAKQMAKMDDTTPDDGSDIWQAMLDAALAEPGQ